MQVQILYVKQDLTNYLCKMLTPIIYEGLLSLYETAKVKAPGDNEVLKIFQGLLSAIPQWNNNQISDETKRIEIQTKLTNLLNLVKTIVKLNIKLYNMPEDYNINSLHLSIKLEDFIFKCYLECSREFYKLPFLFSIDSNYIQVKKQQIEIFSIINKCIESSILFFIPYDIVVNYYLTTDIHLYNNTYTQTKTEVEETKDLNNYIDDLAKEPPAPVIKEEVPVQVPTYASTVDPDKKPYDISTPKKEELPAPATVTKVQATVTKAASPVVQTEEQKPEPVKAPTIVPTADTETDYRLLNNASFEAVYSNNDSRAQLSSNIFVKKEGDTIAKLYRLNKKIPG